MKRFLPFFIFFLPTIVCAWPRYKNPQNPNETYQNDLDIQQDVQNVPKKLKASTNTWTGTQYFPDGSNSLPSISFTNGLTTGLYQTGNRLGLTANGSLV